MKSIVFYFDDAIETKTLTRSFSTDSAKLKEVYYKSLKSADNSASVRLPFDVELANAIKVHNNYNVKTVILDNNTPIFTGYLRKSATFEKTQTNQPINVEIVSPSYLLDVKAKTVTCYENRTVKQIVRGLVAIVTEQREITFTIDDSLIADSDNETLAMVVINKDDNIVEKLDELLFEFGYTFNFTADGNLKVYPIFNAPENITELNGTNLKNSIKQSIKEEQYSKVELTWEPVKAVTNHLFFSDTTGAKDNYKCYQEIPPQTYFLDEANNLCEYDSTEGTVVYVTALTRRDITFDSSAGLNVVVMNEGLHARVSIYNNTSNLTRAITKFDLYGAGYVKKETVINSTGDDSAETYSLKAQFINTAARANNLCKALINYFHYADYSIQFYSAVDCELGSFVTVTDTGIGTITARIIEKQRDLVTNLITYTAEAVSEYTPAIVTETESYYKGNKQDLVNRLNDNFNDLEIEVGYTLDVSPDYVSIPCDTTGAIIGDTTVVSFTARFFNGPNEITEGITKSVMVNGTGTGTWNDNILTIPVSALNRDLNEVSITFNWQLQSRTQIVNVAKLYQGEKGESGDITLYQFVLSDTAVKKDIDDVMTPATITADKQMVSNNGIGFTDYGRLTVQINNNEEEEIKFTQQTSSDVYDATKTYYKVTHPFMLSLGNDKVMAIKNGVAGVFWK